ncbi:MAG: alpha/beta hydrolase [Clostridia bacterium]|nr:alpha/beta hydrolase [Clostridia bacterium]
MDKIQYATRDGSLTEVWYYGCSPEAPLIVDIHGGGYVGGELSWDDKLSRDLTETAHVNVAALEYRRAPAATYPKAHEDAVDAYCAIMADETLLFDRSRVYLLGHSCGAAIAAAVGQLYGGVAGIIMLYPFLNLAENLRPRKYGGFTRAEIKRFIDGYCPNVSVRPSPYVSPVLMTPQAAKKFPPTYIMTCGKDTLSPDGESFFSLLKSNGVKVMYHCFEEAEHGFIEKVSRGKMVPGRDRTEDSCDTQLDYYDDFLQYVGKYIGTL